MFMYLAGIIDRLEQAGFEPGQIAIRIGRTQEKLLLEEVKTSCGLMGKTAHGGSFMGWPIIVIGEDE